MKLFFYPEHILSAYAARKAEADRALDLRAAGSLLTDTQGRDHWSYAEMAIDADAKFLGLRVHTTANLGAYLSTMSLA